jgi:hypothetical protein
LGRQEHGMIVVLAIVILYWFFTTVAIVYLALQVKRWKKIPVAIVFLGYQYIMYNVVKWLILLEKGVV